MEISDANGKAYFWEVNTPHCVQRKRPDLSPGLLVFKEGELVDLSAQVVEENSAAVDSNRFVTRRACDTCGCVRHVGGAVRCALCAYVLVRGVVAVCCVLARSGH